MKILAFDLSLTGTGACLPNGNTLVIRHPSARGMDRLSRIRADVRALCQKDPPDLVPIEGYSYHSKGNAAVSLGELGGVIRLALYDWGYRVVDIPPACRAKYATGKGNAGKDLVLQAAVQRSGRIFPDNNAADAWWLWQMGLAVYAPEHPECVAMPKVNSGALVGVKWPGSPGGPDWATTQLDY